jgi:RNA polymerase-binding transcription factor DksA
VPTPEQLEHFRTLLLRERDAIEGRIREREALIRARVRQPDEPADLTDEAQMLVQHDQAIAENELDRDTLAQVERALRRIEEGTYGISEVSGQPIPLDRLEAVPWATTLVDEEPPAED